MPGRITLLGGFFLNTFRHRLFGSARRQGLEAAWSQTLARDWDLRLAYTWIDATFGNSYLICSGAGCTVPSTPVPAGARASTDSAALRAS